MTKDEALKLALEALKKNHYYMIDAGLPNQSMLNEGFAAITAIEQALAAPTVQEPKETDFSRALRLYDEAVDRLSLAAPTVQIEHCIWARNGNTPCPHTAAQRQFVGLTTREIYNLWEDSGVPFVDWDSFASITRAIEAKLKEKNT